MTGETLLYAGVGLLAVAVLLIVVEAFIPSGGVIGTVAAVAGIAGVVLLFRYSTGWGVAGLLSTLVLGPLVFFFAASMLPSTPMGKRLIGQPSEEEVLARQERELKLIEEYRALVGAEGVALTDLKPVGTARIGGKRYDVLAEGGLIDLGTRIRVTSAEPNLIKVRPVRES
ncbi:MAG: hypothetical protein DYG94_09355 [Leptolyngbya sp. PLA3]|nr:MAG: hypothetical protein EDM82_11975 [Cyanobacteria bacterium CYA]MCE7968938.1 hypothetical protein [Leptolyngbya sp. PL-A3]